MKKKKKEKSKQPFEKQKRSLERNQFTSLKLTSPS